MRAFIKIVVLRIALLASVLAFLATFVTGGLTLLVGRFLCRRLRRVRAARAEAREQRCLRRSGRRRWYCPLCRYKTVSAAVAEAG